jgi:hypothetical protein
VCLRDAATVRNPLWRVVNSQGLPHTPLIRRGGAELSREGLVTALEGLYDYETGLTPRLTFGPNRRIGAAGAYVVAVDTERKEFALAGEWVKAD